MTTSVIRLALTTLALAAALAGCQPLEKNSRMRDSVLKEPDQSFLKKVKNDPFPSAGQAPKQEAVKPSASPSGTAKPNVTVSVGDQSATADGTALATDGDQPTNPTATTMPLTSRNVRPLNRATTGAVRRN